MSDENLAVARQPMVRESPEQKFCRIATRRTRAILKYVRLLGNMTNSGSYKYSTHEVETMFSAVKKAVADTEAKFFTVHEDNFEL